MLKEKFEPVAPNESWGSKEDKRKEEGLCWFVLLMKRFRRPVVPTLR